MLRKALPLQKKSCPPPFLEQILMAIWTFRNGTFFFQPFWPNLRGLQTCCDQTDLPWETYGAPFGADSNRDLEFRIDILSFQLCKKCAKLMGVPQIVMIEQMCLERCMAPCRSRFYRGIGHSEEVLSCFKPLRKSYKLIRPEPGGWCGTNPLP